MKSVQEVSSSTKTTIPEKVAQLYYSHGLFCTTYPVTVVSFALIVAMLCCYPLIHLHLPGNAPSQRWIQINTNGTTFKTSEQPTLEPLRPPYCYVQQVIFRAAVLPWQQANLTLGDAFRAPILETFKLLDIVRNFQHPETGKTLAHVCLHVEAINRFSTHFVGIMPQYSCLVLSPANLWQQDLQRFIQDSTLLSTIFSHHTFQKGKTSIADMLFGMPLFDTGIKRYPLRNRQRFIQFAVTIFMQKLDLTLVNGLRRKLSTTYSLFQRDVEKMDDEALANLNQTLVIEYPSDMEYLQCMPLSIAFVLLFLYYYYSVRKIDLVQFKLGMACTAVISILGSLSMTMGLCFFFGLMPNLKMFPFLVLLVGLENVLVLTKSATFTPKHLDVKIRMAQGLSREGWSITNNLSLEITILTFGLFTFVPAIQEFCIFAIVALLTDFFMQMLFFAPILGIDIMRCSDNSDLMAAAGSNTLKRPLFANRVWLQPALTQDKDAQHMWSTEREHMYGGGPTYMRRSRSQPRLMTEGLGSPPSQRRIPKRLRLFNMWARTRFFQRSFMIFMIIWISTIVYQSGLIEKYLPPQSIATNVRHEKDVHDNSPPTPPIVVENKRMMSDNVPVSDSIPMNAATTSSQSNFVSKIPIKMQEELYAEELGKFKNYADKWPHKLHAQHWEAILRRYNISVSGRSVWILPPIRLAHSIRPEEALQVRHPDEKYGEAFQWQALAAALDPIDFMGLDLEEKSSETESSRPLYPSSVFAIVLTTILCIISITVLSYTVVVLYRCICSRNYAEWRASWFSTNQSGQKSEDSGSDEPLPIEAVPLVLDGHRQQIECIVADGATSLVSCSLDGHVLKVWDTTTGELIQNIDRKTYFESLPPVYDKANNDDILDNSSDYESSSPPLNDDWKFPKLKHRINTNFSHLTDSHSTHTENQHHSNEYDAKEKFSEAYQSLYESGDESNMQLTLDITQSKKYNNMTNTRKPLAFTKNNNLSPIWCIDYAQNLVAVGCANGRVEFWQAYDGALKCMFDDGNEIGVSHIKLMGARVVAARLNGTVDLLQVQTFSQGRQIDWTFSCAYRRNTVRSGSVGSRSQHQTAMQNDSSDVEEFRCIRLHSLKAHQQPISCLDSDGSVILTGSQDHTIRVSKLQDGAKLYALHAHCGPITCLFIDRNCPSMSGSGSQDGMLCVWDLLTGACVYNIQAHDGAVVSLIYTTSYVISLGGDDKLCVWERFHGHLLNTILVRQSFSTQMVMLSHHLVLVAQGGRLVMWDVRTGECVRSISLGRSPMVFIKQLLLLHDAILCDYGNQLRIVRFPLITHKMD